MSVSEREERLAQIRERLEKAGECNWEAQIPAMTGDWPHARIKGLKVTAKLYGFAMVPTEKAELISNAPSDLRWLLERLEQAEGIVRELAKSPPMDEIWCVFDNCAVRYDEEHTPACPYRRAQQYLEGKR